MFSTLKDFFEYVFFQILREQTFDCNEFIQMNVIFFFNYFDKVFGLEVVTMETEDGRTRGYMLINALDDEVLNHEQNDFTEK